MDLQTIYAKISNYLRELLLTGEKFHKKFKYDKLNKSFIIPAFVNVSLNFQIVLVSGTCDDKPRKFKKLILSNIWYSVCSFTNKTLKVKKY